MNIDAARTIFVILLSALFFSNESVLFTLTYVFIFLCMLTATLLTVQGVKRKIIFSAVYLAVMVFQLVHNTMVAFAEDNSLLDSLLGRFAGVITVLIPFIVHRLFSENKNARFYLPSVQDITVFTFNEIIENAALVRDLIAKGQRSFSRENLNALAKDMPRHNSFRYINRGSLTPEYFEQAAAALDDENIYIIISNTGSPASEIISLFTRREYNHASLSFDRDLKTIISYNGGERLYPPGLNMEMLRYFNKKADASIMVYRLPVSTEKKRVILGKIKEINGQGNAYNVFGLVFKFSFRPNIMFCSQFVYRMLKLAGAHYFDRKDGGIRPTDLIEQDYYRKLYFEYEVTFNRQPVPDTPAVL
ncbi:MAG: hypothetical protein LBC88_08400 [Spirochaetaceae bacterium]|nr:hypothetical protein [Spirochaetaceae bacterium]